MRTRRNSIKSVWNLVPVLVIGSLFLAVTLLPSYVYAGPAEDGQKGTAQKQEIKKQETDKDDISKQNLREKKYYYQAFNRRDPFKSLIVGDFEESELDLVDIYSVKLVGVLSGGNEKFAMLEDKNGYGYIIKAGDPVKNGSVISVGDRSLTARLTLFGQTSSVTLRLEGKKGKGE